MLRLREQSGSAVPLAREPGVLRSGGEPPAALTAMRSELCRPLQRVGRRPSTAAAARAVGGILKLRGHALVWLDSRGGQVPGPPVEVFSPSQDVREVAVNTPAARKGRVLVDGGADQRMPELHLAVRNRDQTGSLCALQRIRADAGRRGGL